MFVSAPLRKMMTPEDTFEQLKYIIVADDYSKAYFNSKNELHREDGPALIRHDGMEAWFLNGLRHREGRPAVTSPDGREEWFLNGKRHREGGPAYIGKDNTQMWYRNGLKHREDGPAVIHPNGRGEWYQNGRWMPSKE